MTFQSIKNCRIVIIGLGLMGGSLAKALQGKCKSISAADISEEVYAKVIAGDVIDNFSKDPIQVIDHADVIILATPVGVIVNILELLPKWINRPIVVMDIGSTKNTICKKMETLPPYFDVISVHPMCGKEKLGFSNADPAIFKGATFAIISLKRTSNEAKSLACDLATVVGSNVFEIDAETHDKWVAATSHFPYLLSSLLAYSTPLEIAPLIGSGFFSTARLAATPLSMMLDVITTNRVNILGEIKSFKKNLSTIENLIVQNDIQKLESMLSEAAEHYSRLIGIPRSES